ncbi:MAG: glycosyltransferase family 2 protein [Bacteroidetes bacterium]|nr:glycosyltransferase family 2 protein [Bacteroidota bacterium]
MNFSIIIPTKNRNNILLESLSYAIDACKNHQVEIIIVNDGDKAIELPNEFVDKVKVLKNPKSGVASARNFGAKNATSEHLIFMDDDMWMQADNIPALEQLISTLPQNSCINLNWTYPSSLISKAEKTQFGRYLQHYHFTSLKGWCKDLPWDDDNLFLINSITSQFLYIHKTTWQNVAGYNENFPHAGFEDHDFARRLHETGTEFYIYPKSFLFHNEADRLNPKDWLARKQRGGETRKYAVHFGYHNLALHYSLFKSVVYSICIFIKPLLFIFLKLIPNIPAFDFIYFRIINLLLGTHSFEGYTKTNPID